MKIITNFHNLHPTTIKAAINSLLYKDRRRAILFIIGPNALCCQSGRYGRGIASMSGNDLLVCFDAAAEGGVLACLPFAQASILRCSETTYVTPELWEAPITKIRFSDMVRQRVVYAKETDGSGMLSAVR